MKNRRIILGIVLAILLLSVFGFFFLRPSCKGKDERAENGRELPGAFSEETFSPDEIYETMVRFQEKYPEGMHFTDETNTWDWDENIYSVPKHKGMHGKGCVAFAMELSDAVFGNRPVRVYRDANEIRPGDIVRIGTSAEPESHSAIILSVGEDGTYTLAEANLYGKVHWFRTMNREEMKLFFAYGWSRY